MRYRHAYKTKEQPKKMKQPKMQQAMKNLNDQGEDAKVKSKHD